MVDSEEYYIKNCYNSGKLNPNMNLEKSNVCVGNISGSHKGIMENCYYINNGYDGIGEIEDTEKVKDIIEVNNDTLKQESMVDELNKNTNEFCFDYNNINNGYPILKYQFRFLKGDANGDGKVDFKDMLAINKHRLGKVKLTGVNLEAADVNGDGIADFKDMLKINKYRLGKIDSL